jgi:phenylacetic acid degradation operon negative regulatory protein
MTVKPKSLILGLLLASRHSPLSSRMVIATCELFGINANSARVTLARLYSDGLVDSKKRGFYQLGEKSMVLSNEASRWPEQASRLRPWQGDYACVHTAHLTRSDRTQFSRRERALKLMGFTPLEAGLHIRPNNIDENINAIETHLHTLGLERRAYVFTAQAFKKSDEEKIERYWKPEQLNQIYQDRILELTHWLNTYSDFGLPQAARESYLLGNKAIKDIVFDPLLPAPLINEQMRARFFSTVKEFNAVGQGIWQEFLAVESAMPVWAGENF